MLKSRMYEEELRKRNAEKQVLEDGKSTSAGDTRSALRAGQSRIKDLRTNTKSATPKACWTATG